MPTPMFLRRSVAAAAGLTLAGSAGAQTLSVKVTAATDCFEAPATLVVSAAELAKKHKAPEGATALPCQTEPADAGKVRVTFVVPSLHRGESKVFVLTPGKGDTVAVAAAGKNAEIKVGGTLFTRYDTTTGPNKPYLYPIIGFGGKHLTRRWPLEDGVPGEAKDHPHHRGLWFTHGEMNGVDFWTEVPKAGHPIGKTVHTGYSALVSGPVQGRLGATSDWVTEDGKTIARDTRAITVTPLSGGALVLDFSITITAVGGPLHWGDTKEGTFALRVPESMKSDKPGMGKLVNAEGVADAAMWGKPSPWNDYFGPVDGETLGMAIFDHPKNLRYPTTWHSRTYGLYAANPFGLHDFDATKKTDKHAGDLITPEGKSVTFTYRVYFHKGDTATAHVAAAFSSWSTPPTIEVIK